MSSCHLPEPVALLALIGQCRSGDAVVQLLQRMAVVGRAARSRVQAEPLHVGTERVLQARVSRHDALQSQHLLASALSR